MCDGFRNSAQGILPEGGVVEVHRQVLKHGGRGWRRYFSGHGTKKADMAWKALKFPGLQQFLGQHDVAQAGRHLIPDTFKENRESCWENGTAANRDHPNTMSPSTSPPTTTGTQTRPPPLLN